MHHLGRFDEALDHYERAASMNAYGKSIQPWSFAASNKLLLYRGTTNAALGKHDEALADLFRFAQARPDYPGVQELIEKIK